MEELIEDYDNSKELEILGDIVEHHDSNEVLHKILKYMGISDRLQEFILQLVDINYDEITFELLNEIDWCKSYISNINNIPKEYKDVENIDEYCWGESTECDRSYRLDKIFREFAGPPNFIILSNDEAEDECDAHQWEKHVSDEYNIKCKYCNELDYCGHDWDIQENIIYCSVCGILDDTVSICKHGYIINYLEFDHKICPVCNNNPNSKK